MYFVQFKHLNLKLQWRDSEKKEVLFLRRILFIYYLFASKPTGFGKAIGSLVSAVIANIVIDDAKKKGLATLPLNPFSENDIWMMLFLRYSEMKWNAFIVLNP